MGSAIVSPCFTGKIRIIESIYSPALIQSGQMKPVTQLTLDGVSNQISIKLEFRLHSRD